MTYLISLLTKLFGKRFAPFVAYLSIVIIIIAALWWLRHDAYRDGIADNDAKWQAAEKALRAKKDKVEAKANAKQKQRETQYFEAVKQEKEKIDDAIDNGDSSFDIMFERL